MNLIELKHITKTYKTGDTERKVLDDINLSFKSTGLVAILGKSGSGKSTLLNMLSMLDKPTEGKMIYYGSDSSKWSKKRIDKFHQEDIGMIYQHYNLIEDLSVLENIMLPMLILGKKSSDCKEDAIKLLEDIDFPKNFYNKKVQDLSGGEKERVAMLRALINAPHIVLADEPTGALDIKNSRIAMNLLKKVSNKRLVLVVSHNVKLVTEFADRIIEICDGKIVSDVEINKKEINIPVVKNKKRKCSNFWEEKISFLKAKKHKKTLLLSTLAQTIGIASSIICLSFFLNAKNSVHNTIYNHYDYGSLTVSKEIKTGDSGNGISIVRTVRPEYNELVSIKDISDNFLIENNYDGILKQNYEIEIDGFDKLQLDFSPVYSFKENYGNFKVVDGHLPSKDSLMTCVINETAYKALSKICNPMYKTINFKSTFVLDKYIDNNRLTESIDLKFNFVICGVVKELEFLNTPRFYYSFSALDEYLSDYKIANDLYSLKDIVESSNSNDQLCTCSFRLFMYGNIQIDISEINTPDNIVLSSNSLDIGNALERLIDACSMGLSIFVIICVIGTCLLIGISSLYAYSSEHKNNAILMSIGASKESIISIHQNESLISYILSIVFGVIIALVFSYACNCIIETATGIESVIQIPLLKFHNIPFGFLGLISLISLLVNLASSTIPIMTFKNTKIYEELRDE